jgi:hypothetical protein
MIAYGGKNIVTKEGRFNGRDPQIHEAVVKAVDRLSTLYKEGFIPPSSVNWNDADDNNAFHAKLCVMDYDGTLSTELAMLRKQKDEYNDVLTIPPLLHNDGSQMATQYGVNCAIIPKGAANVEVAKVDGATGVRMSMHVSFPLLANLYLICTLLSTIFSLGDFNSVYFVSGGGPADSTHVLATLGIRYAFDLAQPRLGVAAVISALPLLIPLVITLMRKFKTSQVQL